MSSMSWTTLGYDQVVWVIQVITAALDLFHRVLGSLWVADEFWGSGQGWLGLALSLVKSGALVHVLVSQLLRTPLIANSCTNSVLCYHVLGCICQNYVVFLLANWLLVLFNMCATLFQGKIRTFWREKEGFWVVFGLYLRACCIWLGVVHIFTLLFFRSLGSPMLGAPIIALYLREQSPCMLSQFWSSHRPSLDMSFRMYGYTTSCSTFGQLSWASQGWTSKFSKVIMAIEALNSRSFFISVNRIWIVWIFGVLLKAIMSLPSECATSFLVWSSIIIMELVLDGSSQAYLIWEVISHLAHVIVVDAMSILCMLWSIPTCSTMARLDALSRRLKLCGRKTLLWAICT